MKLYDMNLLSMKYMHAIFIFCILNLIVSPVVSATDSVKSNNESIMHVLQITKLFYTPQSGTVLIEVLVTNLFPNSDLIINDFSANFREKSFRLCLLKGGQVCEASSIHGLVKSQPFLISPYESKLISSNFFVPFDIGKYPMFLSLRNSGLCGGFRLNINEKATPPVVR